MSDNFSVVDKFFGESKDTKKFRLSDQFISTYAGKDPTFGFNGLGEVTYYRTFSRILENGKKERFIDTATRVVEGTYEIQRRYCQRNNLPFDHKKAQDSAQEMFERMWAFKWLPPGRGLWIMGTPFMWRSGGAALNNCFAGDTEYITRDGIKKLKDTVGTTQRVLSTGGKWVNAKIKSFGEQELLKLTVSRGRHSKVIHVTADHRWLVKSKCKSLAIASGFSKSENSDSYRIREVDTSGLKKGMRLAVNFGSGISNNIRPSVVGIMHGICVGDGTTGSDDSNHGTYLYLCGHKDKQLLKYFSEFHITDDLEKCEGGSKRVADLPRFFRQMPNLSEATTYLYGWLAGYFAADGRVSDSGSVQISSKTLSNLETVKSVCAILGIGTHEITSGYQTVTNKGVTKKFLQYRITLFADHLRDEFFLIDEHKTKFQTIRKSGRKKIPQYCHWVVDSVESTGIRQEVYCPQVPDYHTFTLSGNILTGNCGFVSTEDDFAADPSQPFAFAMDMLMLGVGIGFDTKGANKVKIKKPASKTSKYIVYDSREGWVEAFSDLVRSYTINTDLGHLVFDCSEIRPKGSPIKGFGGEASGPEGLIELLSSVDEFLAQRVKQKLSSVDITDLMNMVGKCVVAGNVRRSAEIAFGNPEDIEYISMKNPTKDLNSQEIQDYYNVTNKLYGASRYKAVVEDFNDTVFVKSEESKAKLPRVIEVFNAMNDRRWASNNSVLATVGMDYTNVGAMTAANGEPGYIWLDNMRDYGRMIDGRQPGIDGRVKGSNPCFAGSNNLLTQNGYKSIEQLWIEQGELEYDAVATNQNCFVHYGQQEIINRNGPSLATKVYKTSDSEPIYRVSFSNGQYVDATENHNFIVVFGSQEIRIKLCDLLVGMKVPINNFSHFGAHDDKEFALLAGWCVGDGSLSKQKDGQTTANITCYQNDTNEVMDELSSNMKILYERYNTSSNQNPNYTPWSRIQKHFNHDQNNIRSNVLGRLLKDNGITPGDKHKVPYNIWSSNKETVANFLRGLFGADGSFQINKKRNSASIRLTSVYRNLLNECQLLLFQFGIVSGVYLRRKKRKILMNDGKGGKKLYSTKETYELIINGNENCSLFYNNIGFIQSHKNEKLYDWISNHSNSKPRQYVKIKGIQYIGLQPTYCLTEPVDNEVCVSGIAIGNCVEQSLESYELCVSGNTRIQTKHGAIKIIDLVGKISEVWNGKEWSKVEPKQTGSNRLLRRVTLSDGSYLDATPNHKWSVKNSAGKFVEIQTDQLMFGDELESFSLPNIDGATAIPDILAKLAAGDSSVEKQVVDVYKQEIADQLLDSRKPLPECVMEMGSKNSAEFLASWARTNGSIVLRDSKVIINAPANRLHDLQLLARRARQNDVVVDLESKVLIINNICDKFCVMLGGKNNVEPSNNIQTVVSVDQIPGTHDTYCFNEQKRHKGVFNNVLTHQCNLVESFPHKHDNEEDYMRTIKYAYLYGKTVTLLPTHCDKTNTVMLRNRRIGLSQSGIVQAVEKFGRRRYLQNFCDAAYNEIRRWDRIYSEYFTCRESIKVTSIKPSGCRPWDALTTTDNGILTLEELFELSKHKNGDDWSEMDHEINVIQSKNITKECSGDVMVATKCVDRITKTYDNGISDTVIIKLSHNFELQSTPNHQWFVSARYDRTKKNRYVDVQEWKKASDLTENDILEVVPGIYNNNRHSELFELHDRAISMRGNIAEIKTPKYMNEDLAWLLGYMWGDGSQSYSKYRMRYSDENLFNLHKAQRIILDQFGLESSIKPASEGRNSYELSVGSKNLWHWLLINDILKIKSNADLIPKVVRSSSKSDILAFLAGLLDSDGCIGRRFNDQYCIISMAGGKFARHVQDIALSVGLVFSRSLNARGKNKQETKAMWSLSLMRSSLLPEFELFKKHCNKCVEKSDPSLPWTCELNNDVKILGKVKSVSDGPRVSTFDIEVDDSHWYYAGAIKSHNTVSLIAGATPGIHFPEATSYWRRMRIAKNHSLVKILADAGYHIEPAVSDPENTVVVTFGVEDVGVKPINQVSIWEQMDNVAAIQHYWADNAVSVTIQFQPSEASDIPKILEHYEDRIKAVSFLPHFSHGYAQAPYEAAKKEDIVAYNKTLKPIDFSSLVDKETGEKYCDTDKCTL